MVLFTDATAKLMYVAVTSARRRSSNAYRSTVVTVSDVWQAALTAYLPPHLLRTTKRKMKGTTGYLSIFSWTIQTDRQHSSHQIQALGNELAKLRQQMTELSRTVDELKNHQSPGARTTTASQFDAIVAQSPSNGSKDNVPKHPQFVGPTRPSYGLVIAERSLTQMGIPASPSPSPSGAPSPAEPEQQEATDLEFWAECSPDEMARLLGVFEEEVESVYPFTDILELAPSSEQILQAIRDPSMLDSAPRGVHEPFLTSTDVAMAKLAVATGIAIEAHGKNDLCAAIVESVETGIARISRTEVDLKGIQLLMILVCLVQICYTYVGLGANITTCAEHIPLPLRRRIACMENDWHCRSCGA